MDELFDLVKFKVSVSGWDDHLDHLSDSAAAGDSGSVCYMHTARSISSVCLSFFIFAISVLLTPYLCLSISMNNLVIYTFRYSSLKSYQHTEAFVLGLSQAECLWWGSVFLACGAW